MSIPMHPTVRMPPERLHVSKNTNEELTEQDTNNFDIADRVDHGLVAASTPAASESGLPEEGFDIADREEDVTVAKWVSEIIFGWAGSTHPSRPRPAPGRTKFLK